MQPKILCIDKAAAGHNTLRYAVSAVTRGANLRAPHPAIETLMKRTLKIVSVFALFAVIAAPAAFTQDIRTASALMRRVSEEYAGFDDYVAEIVMTTDDDEMSGTLYYAEPNRLYIEFSDPDEQFILSDGEYLRVHVPSLNTTLSQRLRRQSDATPAGVATGEGLALLRRNFSVAYQSSPEYVSLNSTSGSIASVGPNTEVINLRLDTSAPNEGYRQLILSIDRDYRIRRIVGTTVDYDVIQFDFTDIQTNVSLPSSRFEYESPPASSTFEDFLFESGS